MSRPVSRLRKTLTLLTVVLAAASGQAAGAQEKTPPAIFHPWTTYPIWVSAKTAEQKGLTDLDTFHPQATERITYILSQTPVGGCYEAGPVIYDFAGGRSSPSSLEEAAQAYPVFAYGVVKELTPGFLVGVAGHLATVEVSDLSRGVELGQTYFVFIPVGDFTFLGKKICKQDIRYAGLPSVGDELLVFADETETKEARYFSIDYPEAIVLIAGGKVRLAPRLQQAVASRHDSVANPRSREELLALLPALHATPYEGSQP